MKTYIVTQKILALGATYETREGTEGPVIHTVRGKILTFTPYLEMWNMTGEKTHVLKGNIWKTKFFILTPGGNTVGEIQFPFFAFRKSFTMTIGGAPFTAAGSLFAWTFTAKDVAGRDAFTIQKEIAFRDKFSLSVDASVAVEPVILAAVAVDQRFFQQH